MTKHLLTAVIALTLTTAPTLAQKEHVPSDTYQWPQEPEVAAKLQRWQDLKFGILMHWGVYSVPGMVESWQITSEDWITPDTTRTYEEEKLWYWGLSKEFNPTQFDPTQWARVAREAGMKYFVFTTKHHDGFCLFDTQTTDYKVTNSGFAGNERANVLTYVMDAFRNEGMMAGMYFSKPDWHCPYYWWPAKATPNRLHNYNIKDYPERWERYKQYVYDQVDELMTGYGQVDILWLDGGWCTPPREDINLGSIVQNARRHQPGLIVVDRTCGGEFENYQTPEQTIPDHQILHPWESCITLTQDWGWNDHPQYKSVDRVIAILSEIVAKGGSLLLGVGPTPQGLIEQSSVERMQEIGTWLEANGEAIYGTVPTPNYTNAEHTVWFTASKNGKAIYAIVPQQDNVAMPQTISWQGNLPRRGGRIIDLATGRKVKYVLSADNQITVTLPKGAKHGVALKIEQ